METGWMACRIGWVKFILPFMFVLSPTLLMIGTPAAIIYDSVTAFIGVYYVTVGIVGFFQRDLGLLPRIVMFLAGAAAIVPDSAIGMPVPGLLSGIGVLIGGAVLTVEFLSRRRAMPASGAAE
jgi:TRAP-type uncharacterized transport system fused permease subunit